MIVNMNDLRADGIGTCKQARAWGDRNGISFKDIREGGITTDTLRDMSANGSADDNAYLAMLIAATEARHGRG